jgi:hypothetical protein
MCDIAIAQSGWDKFGEGGTRPFNKKRFRTMIISEKREAVVHQQVVQKLSALYEGLKSG